jgi:DNA invertase Pin-like site-specific DNA recombinase
LGVSAFRGGNLEFGNLRSFLDLVEQGKVARGTYLIVESLDRLSRANVTKAFALLLNIVSNGINVATLSDGQIYTAETLGDNGGQIFLALGSMLRAHDESRTKSQRIGAAWANKRATARKPVGAKKLTRTAPLWLRVSEGRENVVAVAERQAIVQEIFELTRDGWGAFSIARRFNESGLRAWGIRPGRDRKGPTMWHESYIKKILLNRAVLGEFQPHRMEFGDGMKERRVPDGELIADYYPRVISDDLFLAAHAAMASRRTSGRGRKGESLRNIFSGLLFCGHCGRSMRFLNKGSAKRGASQWIACTNQRLNAGCKAIPWRYRPFEEAFIRYLKHIDVTHLLGGERREDQVSKLQSEVRRIDQTLTTNAQRLKNLVEAIAVGGGVSIAGEIRRVELEQATLARDKTKAEFQLSGILNSALVSNREELLKLLHRITVRRDRHVRVEERRMFSAEVRRVVRRVEMFSGFPAHPWDGDTDMEVELLSKLSDHALREWNHYFRVEYLSGETDTIEPYRQKIQMHAAASQRRLHGKFA